MRWWTKAAALRILSLIPGGGSLYAWLQQQVARSLVPNRGRVAQTIGVGLSETDTLSGGTHLDFGVGRHRTIPLPFWALGCERQYPLDVKSVLSSTLEAFRRAKRR